VLTLGIDLSAEPEKTAYALISWTPQAAVLEALDVGADDHTLLPLILAADKVGIDCPIGWPIGFIDFVTAHRDRTLTPGAGARKPDRDTLALRAADRYVRDHRLGQPMSVSSDRIGRAAMRVAGLLATVEECVGASINRDGSGLIVEVYPAAALRQWNFPARAYKADPARLIALVAQLIDRAGDWLTMVPDQRQLCERSDDAFDAVIAGLNARAATQPGAVIVADSDELRSAAEVEGWIAVPTGDLEALDPRARSA
jgi:hypothetical protein